MSKIKKEPPTECLELKGEKNDEIVWGETEVK